MNLHEIYDNAQRNHADPLYDAQKRTTLPQLLAQYWQWKALSESLHRLLPTNLAQHCSVACIENKTLMISADNPVAANRLRMILPSILPRWKDKPESVQKVEIKTRHKE